MFTCEICDKDNLNPTETKKHYNMILCLPCHEKEMKAVEEMNKPENVASRVAAVNAAAEVNQIVMKAQQIDATIRVRQELFNAKTVEIAEIKSSIDADTSIPVDKKHFKLYEVLQSRVQHFQKLIFELNEEIVNKNTEMRALQIYQNELINKLRLEEREHFRQKSANYQPPTVKVSKPRSTGVSKPKFDKALLRELVGKLQSDLKAKGLPGDLIKESTIQTICVSRGLSVEAVIEEQRKNLGL